MEVAQRMGRLSGEGAFQVLAKAKALESQGREIIHLEIGEPDFDTPQNIVEEAIQALRAGYTHYSPSAGIPELREEIAEHICDTRGMGVKPSQVVVTPGAKPIIFFTILALVEEGDEVIYPNPGFPTYESVINFVGATPVPLPLREEYGFRFDPDEFRSKVSPRTRLIIINSPHNPTGGILTREELVAIAEVARERDIMVLSDEIYCRIIYEGSHMSIATIWDMQDRTVIVDGFSKSYAMTGWRLGYGVMPEWLAEQVTLLMINSNSCTATFVQRAGLEALRGPQDEVERMVAAFRERRDLIAEGLCRIGGFRCSKPQGAFYVFPNVEGTGMGERELADYLLNEAGVAVLPGSSFGRYGRGFLRLSYANSIENMEKALVRIEEAVSRLG